MSNIQNKQESYDTNPQDCLQVNPHKTKNTKNSKKGNKRTS